MNHKTYQLQIHNRDKEIKILEQLFHDICKGNFETLRIRGMSGTGKTALINHVVPVLTQPKGYFLSGKFEQYAVNEPYKPFVQAFTDMIHYMLTESKGTIAHIQKKFKSVIGNNGALIASLIPEIEFIIGPQKATDHFDIEKIRRPFETVFVKLLQSFASQAHPLVLFLDDIQWADASSINLINTIANDVNNKYLLMICAHREEDFIKRDELIKHTFMKEIELTNLDLSSTYDMIRNHFDFSLDAIKKVSAHIYVKTLGNPLYTQQIIGLIKKENIVRFNDTEDKNLEKLMNYIENIEENQSVLDMVFQRVKRVFSEDMQILKMIGCMSNFFDFHTISLIIKKDRTDAAVLLSRLIGESILLPVNEKKEIISMSHYIDRINSGSLEDLQFKFIHDKIHKAVYDLLDEYEKRETHYYIGKILLSNIPKEEIKNNIYMVITHINFGLSLIVSNDERSTAAELNYLAGIKAKSMAAFQSAYQFFKTGIEILPEQSNKELTYHLYYELYQALFLRGEQAEAEEIFEILLKLSANNVEISKVYTLNAVLLSFIDEYQLAIEAGIKALYYLDFIVKDKHYKLQIVMQALKTIWLFRNRRLNKLTKLHKFCSEKTLLVFETVIQLTPTANLYNQDLFTLFVLKMTNVTAKEKSKYSPIGLSGAAIFNSGILRNYKKAGVLENLALSSCEEQDDKLVRCITYFILSTMVTHWTHHCRVSLQYAYQSFHDGLESGEFFFTGYAMTTILETKYVMGNSIGSLLNDCNTLYQTAINMDFNLVTDIICFFEKYAYTLKSESLSIPTLIPDDLEEKLEKKASNDILSYYILETQLHVLKGNYREALAVEEKAYKKLKSIPGYILFAEHIFYYSLAITLAYDQLSQKEKQKYSRILKKNTKELKKWAAYCQENYMHKYLLIKAEIARINMKEEVISLYDQAIESAHRNGYVQNEAIINECAALYYKRIGRDSVAGLYMNEAYRKYKKWGANAKTKQITRQWEHVIHEENDATIQNNKFQVSNEECEDFIIDDGIVLNNLMDVYYRVMNTLDKKNILYELLEGTMKITNADKGYILIAENKELFVKASYEPGLHNCHTTIDDGAVRLPKRIIRYVAYTKKDVLYHINIGHDIFLKDTYIIENKPFAIVCIPFFHQNELLGILYLERTKMEKSFNRSHVEAWQILIEKIMHTGKLEYLIKSDLNQFQLTQRELEVLKLLAQGKSNDEIAKELNLTVSTVKSHLLNIYGKLGVNKRIQAVVKARELDLISG